MRRRTIAALVCSAAIAAATLPAAATQSGPGTIEEGPMTVETGAVFSNPVIGDGDGVGRYVRGLVDLTPPGERIRVASFVISGDTGMEFTESLLAARARGVEVQVILDGWQIDKPAAALLIEELGTDEAESSWVHVCGNLSPEGTTSSCLGTKGQHNKFYLFSEVGGQTDVVVQASANFTDRNVLSYWNNAVTVTGNHGLYGSYNEYFEAMLTEVQNPDYHWSRTSGGPSGPVTANFFPSATDTVEDRLSSLGCKANGTSEIRIGMSEWDDTRIGIAERLAEMAEAGCTVRVVHGPVDDAVLAVLEDAGIEHRALDSNDMPGRIHSKYLIAKDLTGRQSGGRLVITGSHNYNSTSLHRNDEAYLELRDAEIYRQYEENFETMWAAAAG